MDVLYSIYCSYFLRYFFFYFLYFLFFFHFLIVRLFCVAAVPYFARSVSSCSQYHYISIYILYTIYIRLYVKLRCFYLNPSCKQPIVATRRVHCLLDLLLNVRSWKYMPTFPIFDDFCLHLSTYIYIHIYILYIYYMYIYIKHDCRRVMYCFCVTKDMFRVRARCLQCHYLCLFSIYTYINIAVS